MLYEHLLSASSRDELIQPGDFTGWGSEGVNYTAHFGIPTEVVYLQHCLVNCYMAGPVSRETAAVSAKVLCTPYNMHLFTVLLHSKPHIRRVHVCLAVT